MRTVLPAFLLFAGVGLSAAGTQDRAANPASATAIVPTGLGESIDRDIEKVRKATEKFKDLDRAVDAGYERDVPDCIANPPQGGMGFHHAKGTLYDSKLEVDKPEILVYERKPGGEYKLNGVEYIVPIPAWSKDEPPTIMGQALKRAPRLGIWYLHVWIWEPNPKGLFDDWNPNVKC